MSTDHLSRRSVLKAAAVAGAGAAVARVPGLAAQRSKVPVVALVTDPASQNKQHEFNQEAIQKMVFRGVRATTGEKTDGAAWKKLFKPNDVVGLKVNCLFGMGASTHPEVVFAIIEGLKLAGVKPENMIIWDRNDGELMRGGYEINRDGPGVKCYGTNGDYEDRATEQGSFKGRITKILTQKCTALINVPILKDHGIAGVTISFKNHLGTCDNPGAQHGNHCHPFLSDLNSIPAIKDKTRLIVVDAVRPLANGGPGLNRDFLWDFNSVIVGTDPVAVDYHGWQIIEARRKEIGLPSLADAGRPVQHIARGQELGLGVGDPGRIKLERFV